mgnify:CR=1 FL=1
MSKTNESSEDYLERILMLEQEGNTSIHAIDIANSMGFSKPSVSIALKKLEEAGYVKVNKKSVLSLTDAGREIAKKIYDRHVVIRDFFISIGVDPKTASKDACKIEHDLSDETYEAFVRAIKK